MTHPAKQLCLDVAAKHKIAVTPIRVFDTMHDNAPAWQYMPGLVVYEDSPNCIMSVGDPPGRWCPA